MIFGKHKRVALQFSGGKDSLALLYLMKPYWEQLTVAWVNTGDAFPETVELMVAVAAMVPHFLEVTSDQPAQIAKNGFPADILSIWDTPMGREIDSSSVWRVQTPLQCCGENMWVPMEQAMQAQGFTLILRGQRNAEAKKGFVRSGHIEAGIEYWFPLEDWSEDQVLDFLEAHGVPLPASYSYFNSSFDCMTCTAYLAENHGKLQYLERFHPREAEIVRERLGDIRTAAEAELWHLTRTLEA